MRAVLAIAAVELRRFLKDRSNLFFAFLFPLLLIVLIGSQFGGDAPTARVSIAGPDGALRAAVAQELRSDGVEVSYADADDVRAQLARSRVDVGIFLTAHDISAFDAGSDTTVEVVTGPQAGGQVALQRVRTAIQRVMNERAQVAALVAAGVPREDAQQALGAALTSARAPDLRVSDLSEEEQEFSGLGQFDQGAASQTLLFVFLMSLTGSASLIQARREGVLRRALAAPVSARQAVLGQALGRFAIAFTQGTYIMVGTWLLFDVDWGSWPLALTVLGFFAAVASAVAMVVGSVMDNDRAAAGVGAGAGLVLAALGGCMTPLEFFPDGLRTVAHVTPHAWAYEAFAEVQRHNGTLQDIAPQLAVLAGMAVLLLALGAWLLKRSVERAL
jgi:ABC-2 type transport system permease protein